MRCLLSLPWRLVQLVLLIEHDDQPSMFEQDEQVQ